MVASSQGHNRPCPLGPHRVFIGSGRYKVPGGFYSYKAVLYVLYGNCGETTFCSTAFGYGRTELGALKSLMDRFLAIFNANTNFQEKINNVIFERQVSSDDYLYMGIPRL
jgi:hypothetical protein